jgi:hypothetical protein
MSIFFFIFPKTHFSGGAHATAATRHSLGDPHSTFSKRSRTTTCCFTPRSSVNAAPSRYPGTETKWGRYVASHASGSAVTSRSRRKLYLALYFRQRSRPSFQSICSKLPAPLGTRVVQAVHARNEARSLLPMLAKN